MEKKNQIVMLKSNQLKHHPENPRKSFGDLEELSASILQNGILQNLTVVPVPDEEDSYYIVIGNRRFEAGQIAGLEEYPCHISNMSYVEQLQTMLIENMQRSDLTLIEQADGFEQLTLNGFSVEDISSSTGFSQSTVRRRLTVAKLDKETVADAYSRGATLDEFIKASEIEDVELRAKCLESAGTSNFNWEFQRAKKREYAKKHLETLKPILEGFATEVASRPSGSNYFKYIGLLTVECPQVDIPNDLEDRDYYFYILNNSYQFEIDIYYISKKSDNNVLESKPVDPNVELAKDRRNQFEQLIDDVNSQLKKFIAEAICRENYKGINLIGYKYIYKSALTYDGFNVNEETIYEIYQELIGDSDKLSKKAKMVYDVLTDEEKFESTEDIFSVLSSICPGGLNIAMILSGLGYSLELERLLGNPYNSTAIPEFDEDYKNTHQIMYDFLCDIGYQMSDVEKQIIDGTHELYKPIEEI